MLESARDIERLNTDDHEHLQVLLKEVSECKRVGHKQEDLLSDQFERLGLSAEDSADQLGQKHKAAQDCKFDEKEHYDDQDCVGRGLNFEP